MTHRVAIVGAGMIAHRHVTGWRDAGAEVTAVADVNAAALQVFAQRHGIDATASDYRELLSEADIVDVCTPPWLHAPMTIAALEAGTHVLCEKPFALNAAQAEEMAATADSANKILACRQGDTRLSREARTVHEVVHSGVLGQIYFMRLISRGLYRPGIEYNPGAKWFLDRSKAGGGALYDWGVYDLELLYSIFGKLDVTSVTATTFTGVDSPEFDTPFDVEEHAAAMLTLRDGVKIFWERGWATHLPPESRWEFYGTAAGFSFVPHSDVMAVDMDPRITRYAPSKALELPVPVMAPAGRNVYKDFVEAVEGQHPPACSGWEAAHMLGVIERIYAAA